MACHSDIKKTPKKYTESIWFLKIFFVFLQQGETERKVTFPTLNHLSKIYHRRNNNFTLYHCLRSDSILFPSLDGNRIIKGE